MLYYWRISELPIEIRDKFLDDLWFDEETFLQQVPEELMDIVRLRGISAARELFAADNGMDLKQLAAP